CDVAIIGGGIAGLTIALNLPEHVRVVLMTKAALGESNTRYAQGGLAAAVGPDDDPELHLRDTLAAGAGLVDETATSVLAHSARDAVAWLIAEGAHFDEQTDTTAVHSSSPLPLGEGAAPDDLAHRYDLAREAAHSRRRVLHARDATGAEIERALVAAMRARPGARVLEDTQALDLVLRDGVCVGVDVLHGGATRRILARRGVVLANGGAGQLWLRTSNPAGATADGLALAWRAGAVVSDVEFVQFHPTTLVSPSGETFLISEAVRGEGAWLRNAAGERFMPRYSPDAELAPRDVVARAILSEMLSEQAPSAFLDLRHLPADEVYERFPTIAAACRRDGLDLAHDLIPVAPAAHYFMGGVTVDTWGRTTLPGLFAVGEVSCTGVHGANRLASNSLLEGLVFGRLVASLLAGASQPGAWPTTSPLPGIQRDAGAVVLPERSLAVPVDAAIRQQVREAMWRDVSLRRDVDGLTRACDALRRLASAGPVDPETANMLLAAQLITTAALARRESRGGHYRSDYPNRDASLDGVHSLLRATTITAPQETREAAAHV
ncbi:MAG TPA: L-aspartate oxidase, partial [Ktedonobacterales bacterium]|nr:L-aspartate oxidase [Ktedonobacterales bacterium]